MRYLDHVSSSEACMSEWTYCKNSKYLYIERELELTVCLEYPLPHHHH